MLSVTMDGGRGFAYDIASEFEGANRGRQGGCIALQPNRSSSSLFDHGGVLLGNCIHLCDGLIDLFDTERLFLAGRLDFIHYAGYVLNAIYNFTHGRAGLGH